MKAEQSNQPKRSEIDEERTRFFRKFWDKGHHHACRRPQVAIQNQQAVPCSGVDSVGYLIKDGRAARV
jgi:hypothetical protein